MVELYARPTEDNKTVLLANGMFGRRTITVNIEHHAFVDLWDKYVNAHPKILIQDAFPMLNNNECVFLITGITPEDWDNIFPKGDKK